MAGGKIVERLARSIEHRDVRAFADLYAPDAVLYHPLSAEPIRGLDLIEAGEQALFDAFSDIEVEVRRVVADGSHVAAEVVLRARNSGSLDVGGQRLPPSGRRIEVPSAWFFQLGPDGRIVEEHDYFDTAAFASQLGISG